MPPQSLAVLPADILLQIVADFVDDFRVSRLKARSKSARNLKPSFRFLWPLSLSCKYLNGICSNWIFHEYRLLFRIDELRAKYNPPKRLYPQNGPGASECTLSEWSDTGVQQRIAHFASKAAYVQVLSMEDCGSEELPTFPEQVVVQLADALKGAVRLQSLHIKGEGVAGPIYPLFWSTLASMSVAKLEVRGVLPPSTSVPMLHVNELKLAWHGRSANFLRVVDPTNLELEYSDPYGKAKDLPALFKPCSTAMRSVKVTYAMPPRPTSGVLFDLSNIPQASVQVILKMCCQYKSQLPALWEETKKYVRTAFVEGLDGYDVRRSVCSDMYISRPPLIGDGEDVRPNFKPEHLAHLEADLDEGGIPRNHVTTLPPQPLIKSSTTRLYAVQQIQQVQ